MLPGGVFIKQMRLIPSIYAVNDGSVFDGRDGAADAARKPDGLARSDAALSGRRDHGREPPADLTMTIKHRDLAGIDLNLVVALDALLTESSVTRAAAKVGITQSAMSSSLARLRRLLGDELLTRTPDGMRPTPRSLALVEPVRAALRQFQGIVLREDDFVPSQVERSFTLAIPGSVEVRLIPRLLAFLAREAPGIRLHLVGLDYGSVLGDLDADRIDMAVGMISEGQVHHKVRPLYPVSYTHLTLPTILRV